MFRTHDVFWSPIIDDLLSAAEMNLTNDIPGMGTLSRLPPLAKQMLSNSSEHALDLTNCQTREDRRLRGEKHKKKWKENMEETKEEKIFRVRSCKTNKEEIMVNIPRR